MKVDKKGGWIIIIFIIFFQIGGLIFLSRLIGNQVRLLVTEKNQLIALEAKEGGLTKLQNDFNIVSQDINLLNEVLPNKEKIISLINNLETEASLSGIIAKVSFSNQAFVSEPNNIKSINFSLNVEGSYFKIIDFIKKIEKMPQVIVVEKITFQSSGGLENKNNAILQMKCYTDPKF